MDSDFMAAMARGIAGHGIRVARFEFPYMARRRAEGGKRPPDRQPVLLDSFRAAVAAAGPGPVAVGGKSMGGRMASLIAPEVGARALVVFGFPFHAAGKPEKAVERAAHLADYPLPALILQGERDPMGNRDSLADLPLGERVTLAWIPDGDHSLVPRKKSGHTREETWALAIDSAASLFGRI